jgi:GNAT superfamily N-acetyltransferase
MVTTTNQLLLAEVDHDMLRAWQERAGERASDFELGLWRGPYPEEELERAAAMMESANLVPREQLDLEDFHFTPEQLRDRDLSMVQRGFDRWTLYAEHRESGQIAGFTEVLWNPSKPDLLEQGGTCVFEEYQNRGLGRWLKAAMIDIVERECPQARRIQTGNANSNAPMLSINREMGFKPYIEVIFWQAEIDRIREYLGAPAATAG